MQRNEVTFQSAGVRCAAWLYRPVESRGGSTPCVVLAHGFSGVRDQRLDAYAERFAQAGLAALVFDYRHFGDSDGTPRQLLDIGHQLEDWRAAIACARALEGIDAARIAIWGVTLPSLGIGQALMLMREALRDQLGRFGGRPPHMIAAVGSPGSRSVMNTPDAERGLRGITSSHSTWRNEVAARIGLHVAGYRPGRHAARIRCPILFCVADNDDLTAPGLVLKAFSNAPRGEIKRYPIGHFDIYIGEWFERAVADQANFLTRHLLGREAAFAGG